ncbi:xanthine dehydrogenase family protein molybdopterin-binding subunit [Limobrevibacterium gyesilva]|uniref:Xanthine dehydrogenase family protein molybdopterin-binding subunit n=1 Tax=Limobrevibacterium gyesilva TaxID=2991712 RepID=A0AA41YIL9_9PROT|nr:xanthine dehydrogenase family protein molybdopterin-binding subunit [Limobrevibacterium gyesilva]MCW3473754.1 xanthine dehydrogenase family protein molybdopterin-binding subunit [Limobrevibacterium gyesilva]
MNAPVDPTRHAPEFLQPGRFAVGQPVSRKEDPVLLRGEGRYTDDLNLPGQAYAVMVRSRVAHGVLRGLDTAEAKAMPGVLGIYTVADLKAAGIKTMPANVSGQNHDGRPVPKPAQWALAEDKVRYVGDPIAMVVAETAKQAKDAAEAVFADIDALPAVTEAAAAAKGDVVLHAEAPDNVVLDWKFGDAALVDAAFARAAHVTRLRIRNSRVVVCAMEPRSAIAEYDADGRYILRVGCQGTFGLRNAVRGVMDVPPEKMRVLTGNVGGSFGMKASCYPEYICALHAARQLGRPVKWTDERSESFLSDSHGRDHDHTAELALDKDGHFLALRVTGYGNVGAYLSNSTTLPPTMNVVKNIIGVYRTPAISVAVKCMFTNTTPVGAYRGAGRPEGNYYMERLVDTAAREMGIDTVELRRRNHIAPELMPYKAPSTMEYDSGDFPTVLDKALASADWDGYAARRADSRRRGKLRGRGIGHYLEVTAPANNEMGGIRFEADGTVTIITGTLDYGQGHATPFAQVLVDKLGVPFEKINLVQGDSDELLAGGGTGGSRSIMNSGGAIIAAGNDVIEKGRKIAAYVLEAAVADIEFAAHGGNGGRFSIAGTDRGIGIMELAAKLREGMTLPDDVPATLDAALVFPGVPSAFPNGCHIAEVEVDPETGEIDMVKYHMVNDFGTLVNPMLVAGQAHGGVVQGIGQALTEAVAYDEDGQFLTGSYMDYALPRADQAPDFVFESHPVPARTNELGAKGCGEAGCAGSLPAVMNAVVDALAEFGITHIDMPATPQKVWRAIQAARAKAA